MAFMDWEWVVLMTRWLVYLCISGAVGGLASFCLFKRFPALFPLLLRYSIAACVMGFVATGLHFLVRVGALAETGFSGMFDPLMVSVLWGSSVGEATLYRLIGFGVLILSMIASRKSVYSGASFMFYVAILGCVLIAISFTKTGHIAQMTLLSSVLLTAHILLTFWWMGSLYPLWIAARRLAPQESSHVMHVFGKVAVVVVVGLVVCGGVLSYQLTGWVGLLSSEYGFWLLLKIALVGLILVLAGVHKLFLVPAILAHNNAQRLATSLLFEKLLGMSILAVTTVLTTLVGPAH